MSGILDAKTLTQTTRKATTMQHTTIERGFDHMEPIPSERGGEGVSESSNAEYADIWLRYHADLGDITPATTPEETR